MDEKVARTAFWGYMLTSGGLALLFAVLTLGDKYTTVARIGGAVWIFLLGLIVTMPIFIPWAKKKYGGGSDEPIPHH